MPNLWVSVERGEEITIIRHGKEVARLFRLVTDSTVKRRLREQAQQRKLGRFNWSEWKAFRDEGRP
jgi:antitoxin (DNA-binding transcriptional repressor) of toxin-antitoxin stability system